MVRHILTTALFSFAVLALSASQLRADADGMNSIYSATECTVDAVSTAGFGGNPASALYRTSYSLPPAPNLKGITNTMTSTSATAAGVDGSIIVNCPLPFLDLTGMYPDSVVVTIVDGTAQDNVSCRLRACDGGVGVGFAGTTGQCVVSNWRWTDANNPVDGYTPLVPPGGLSDYVSIDLDFITFNYETEIGTNPLTNFATGVAGLGSASALSNFSHPYLNPVDFSLECAIPPQDANQAAAGINTFGYSYIQSYAVNP